MISIIIPTFNESEQIRLTIGNLKLHDKNNQVKEILIVDGGSTDNSIQIASAAGAKTMTAPRRGRAAQMNFAASVATGDVLYFLHADTIPPPGLVEDILSSVENGFVAGCYRLSFDLDHWFLKANCWFTRFDINAVRFGDQSLFVSKAVFKAIGGFREDLYMMEDQEIIGRIKRQGQFKVMQNAVITSARKYRENGVYRMQLIFFRIWLLYYLGYSQKSLLLLHKKLIRNHKL
jgi:rSAM/selenodomain-associated transferase 2